MDFYYDYGDGAFGGLFGNPEFMAVFSVIIGLLLVSVVIGLLIRLVLYILRSIGLHRLAVNRGMSGAGLEWIPFVGSYRIGSIADDIASKSGTKSYYRYVLLIGGIINFISSWVVQITTTFPMLARFFNDPFGYGYSYRGSYRYWMLSGANTMVSMISIAVFVITVIALNRVYKCYRPVSSTSWTVLSVIFPFMQSIFPFVIRNSAPVSGWGAEGYYPAQNQGWQTPPPQYPLYGQQPPADSGYYPPQYGQAQQPQYMPPPVEAAYQPPAAPNPPEPWELEDPASQPPPQAPWEKND